jgi:replication fork clamp-binding protein CrfC
VPPVAASGGNAEAEKAGKKDLSEWGEFLHKPNEMFYDFAQIREEIVRETDRLTGKNKGVSNVAIHLKIYSPHVLNLTLVDLPGITKVPVGDQPSDIEAQIRKMALLYIEKPNAIILAVTPANSDLANSDALHMAREVDPEGQRTIGVLTKLDIMDRGTDAMDTLCGRVIPLRLGFVGVVNRSQQDIIADKPIRASLKAEMEYFTSHPAYRTIANRCGTAFLARTLNRLLMQHIRDTLPELKVKVNKMMVDAQLELATYGDSGIYDSRNGQGALLLQILTKFAADYRDAIDGKLTESSTNELYGGARINYIFTEVFAKCLNGINPSDGLTLNDIRTAIRNATGPRSALFVPEMAFELLVKRQISRLEEPALQCVELAYDELQRIVSQLENKDLLRFTNLRERVVEVVNNLLQKLRKPTREMINNLLALELAYINTNHPDFIAGGTALSTIFERMQRPQSADAYAPGAPAQPAPLGAPPLQQNPVAAPAAAVASAAKQTGAALGMSQHASGVSPPSSGAAPKDGFFNTFFGGKDPVASAAKSGQAAAAAVGKTAAASPAAKGKAAPAQAAAAAAPAPAPAAVSGYGARLEKLEHVPTSIKTLSAPSEKERFETELIQSLLVAYFDIVRKNQKDLVPKSVMHFLVNASKEHIQNELVTTLYKEELFVNLLEESPAIASRRSACKSLLDILRKAHDILNEVRDFPVPNK